MVRYRFRALLSAVVCVGACAGVFAGHDAPAHAAGGPLTPNVDVPRMTWAEIARQPVDRNGNLVSRASCNPVNTEVCGSPYNDSNPPSPDIRYVRTLRGLVYASDNTNGPHTIDTKVPSGEITSNRPWLTNYSNCRGYGLVFPQSQTLPSQSTSLNGSGYSSVWPRYFDWDTNKYQAAKYDDIQYRAWVSPYLAANRFTSSGTYGWWYGCWSYRTEREQANNLRPQGSLDSVTAGNSALTISGWAFDPNVTGPVNVAVTISGVDKGRFGADVSRSDVATEINKTWSSFATYDARKGFSETFAVGAGDYSVCVSVPDVVPNVANRVTATPDGTSDVSLGCRQVSIKSTLAPT